MFRVENVPGGGTKFAPGGTKLAPIIKIIIKLIILTYIHTFILKKISKTYGIFRESVVK